MMVLVLLVITVGAVTAVTLSMPEWGRAPRGARLERMKRSPNYRDGAFHNRHDTPMMTGEGGKWSAMLKFIFGKSDNLRPQVPIKSIKTDLRALPRDSDLMVWFGHSSYLLQLSGRRILVDPVFVKAAPVSFVNRPFKGSDLYKPQDMPDIDLLIITHDHWDHLDYETVKALKGRIGRVVCGLGVGEHFERWGFDPSRIVEMDWDEDCRIDSLLTLHCLTARHFSGRGLQSNGTLWASFMVETPRRTLFIGGDGGYDTHFAQIGRRFPHIDWAIMENGQYNEDWRYIHMMPQYMEQAARDLGARHIVTVHHSKYALSRHPWNEPLKNIEMMKRDSLPVSSPLIGEVLYL